MTDDHQTERSWPGESLGLPEHGPGSVAPLGARALAFVIDIVLAALVAGLFTAPELPKNWSLLSWFVMTAGMVAFFGFTPGMAVLGIRVARIDGTSTVGLVRAVPRTVLTGLVLPAVAVNADGRGWHDRAFGTVVVRTRGQAAADRSAR